MNAPFQPPFPVTRLRRLRQTPALRRLVRETQLAASQLVLPFFVRAGRKLRHPIGAMPGVFQLSPDEVVKESARLARNAPTPNIRTGRRNTAKDNSLPMLLKGLRGKCTYLISGKCGN